MKENAKGKGLENYSKDNEMMDNASIDKFLPTEFRFAMRATTTRN